MPLVPEVNPSKNLSKMRNIPGVPQSEKKKEEEQIVSSSSSTPEYTQPQWNVNRGPGWALRMNKGGRKAMGMTAKFNRCVKSVRKTVRARKGSTKESAAIGICTKSVLQSRGRTMKRYRKGRLITQKK